MSAFGIGYKQKAGYLEGFDQASIEILLAEATGYGRLNSQLNTLNRKIDLLMYKLVGQCLKYDMAMVKILG